MRLTLLIPELLWSEPGDSEAFSGSQHSTFAKILASRRPQLGPAASPESVLLELLGLSTSTALAPLRATADGLGEAKFGGHCLCADPVHLRFHQERLILADGSQLALSEAELTQIEDSLNTAFGKGGEGMPAARFVLRGLAGQRGYVWLDHAPQHALLPLSQRVGREIRPSDLGEDPLVRRLANEVQMLLHAHPVNTARAAAGQPTLNALWLWGNGTSLPTNLPSGGPFSRLASTDAEPLVAGLAHALRLPLSVGLPPLLGRRPDTLLYVDQLSNAAQYQDSAAYAQAWRELEQKLLAPILSDLRRLHLRELTIVSPAAYGTLRWRLTPPGTWLSTVRAALQGGQLSGLARQLRAAEE
jgi:hypothetical protein